MSLRTSQNRGQGEPEIGAVAVGFGAGLQRSGGCDELVCFAGGRSNTNVLGSLFYVARRSSEDADGEGSVELIGQGLVVGQHDELNEFGLPATDESHHVVGCGVTVGDDFVDLVRLQVIGEQAD